MKIIDLFCGIGGLSMGFEQAGFEQVEYLIGALKTFIEYELSKSELQSVPATVFQLKFDEIQSKINGLKGKSENELMDAMIKEANRLKSQGKFNALELDEAFERAKGILSAEQLAKLRGLIDMLK